MRRSMLTAAPKPVKIGSWVPAQLVSTGGRYWIARLNPSPIAGTLNKIRVNWDTAAATGFNLEVGTYNTGTGNFTPTAITSPIARGTSSGVVEYDLVALGKTLPVAVGSQIAIYCSNLIAIWGTTTGGGGASTTSSGIHSVGSPTSALAGSTAFDIQGDVS